MSVSSVEAVNQEVRSPIMDCMQAGFLHWLEECTRSTVIDPIITALGWDNSATGE